MNFLSLCSGIEAASVAFAPLGWKAVGFSEIDPFACALLKAKYPDVKNYGDITRHAEWDIETPVDLICGGTPCQSFSVAGKRAGMDDSRGQLTRAFVDVVAKHRPRWFIWENVPGVLSSGHGRDLTGFLLSLRKLGYGLAGRVLDAQFFGTPQRRRRFFVVGHLRAERYAFAALFDSTSLQGIAAPRRDAVANVAAKFKTNPHDAGRAVSFRSSTDGNIREQGGTGCLTSNTDPTSHFLAYGIQANIIGREAHNGGNGLGFAPEIAPTLTKMDQHGACAYGRLAYLTEVECERLQGFPDNYTNITYRGKPAPRGKRLAALGNSWAVPVAAWVGARINFIDKINPQF